MLNVKFIFILLLSTLTGCASSSDLERSANRHAKAGDYYESIGQPNTAREEYKQAKKDRDYATELLPILVDLFDFFNDK